MSSIIKVPVIIIGGGGCGLTMSSFLSDYGIDHFLFERHLGTSILPKAHVLSQRTMEILRQHNMADEITKQGAPLKNFSQVAWATSLGGSEPTDGQIIDKKACFGGDDGSAKAEMYK
jgi:2,4-dichlorophenol 6-monooxygenase